MYVLPFGQMSLWGYQCSLKCYLKNYIWNNKIISKGNIFFISVLFPIANSKYRGSQRIGPHDMDVLSVIFGSLLGDSYAEKRIRGVGTRINFYQEDSHYQYILWLHNYFKMRGYCSDNIPILKTRLSQKGKIRKVGRFSTWTYTSFNWIHDLWYDKGVKKVPMNIGFYLTPLALAIWIMDDGSKVGKNIKLCTNCFTYNECLVLVNVLNENFSLKASIQSAGYKDQYQIYILKESMTLLKELIGDLIIPEMRYKIP